MNRRAESEISTARVRTRSSGITDTTVDQRLPFSESGLPLEPVPDTELLSARRALKAQRRARARYVERRVMVLMLGAILLGSGIGFLLIQLLFGESDAENPPVVAVRLAPPGEGDSAADFEDLAPRGGLHAQALHAGALHAQAAAQSEAPMVGPPRPVAVGGEARPEIPALTAMLDQGLTIVAEGLPDLGLAKGQVSPEVAAEISCRLAFGIWEFSPNHRFRFLSSCQAFDGEILVGAYTLEGADVLLSPLPAGQGEMRSLFKVERPSEMQTGIKLPSGLVTIRQRVNVIKTGLLGDDLRFRYQERNRLRVPSAPPKAAEAVGEAGEADPLLKLFERR